VRVREVLDRGEHLVARARSAPAVGLPWVRGPPVVQAARPDL